MNILLALLAQLLHLGLMLAAAPLLAGLLHTLEARLDGRSGPPLLQPWRELRRLLRKQPRWADAASGLGRAAAPADLALVAAAAALVPSFCTGMAFDPVADLFVVFGFLGLARALRILAALDGGVAGGGLLAARRSRLMLFATVPALFAAFTLALLAGTSNLDLIVVLQREGLLQPASASALAAAALIGVVLAADPATEDPDLGGPPLAALRLAEALRLLVWLDLLSAAFLPIGMAEAADGPVAWAIGFGAWAVKLLALMAAPAVARRILGGHRPRAAAELLAAAGLLAIVAAVFALSSAVTA
ncbi:MAG: NADH-quinone oxidoreductase subunit H [Rhodospirillales bacterium]|nr:NADH-quinone oxidoreductase subunit H [Rhodospirillales bacterium]